MKNFFIGFLCGGILIGSIMSIVYSPQQETIEEVVVEEVIEYKEVIRCKEVCNEDLVAYAWEISNGDRDFILTITHESKWDWKAEGDGGEKGLCQWTSFWKEFRNSREFSNPLRQIDKCREQYQGWLAAGEDVLAYQLKGYKQRHKWRSYFWTELVPIE